MTEFKHTPGPWDFISPDGHVVRHPQVYSDTGPVCNATWLGDGRIEELRANARPIAAAPDLLVAAEWAIEKMIDDTVRLDPRSRSIEQIEKAGMLPAQIYKARSAIAKATGVKE